MKQLSKEQREFAVARLQELLDCREISQTQLEDLSGISQSTISKILKRLQEPSSEILSKLFRGMGLKLSEIISETEFFGHELIGYLATPLTGLSTTQDSEVRRLVAKIKTVASATEFDDPRFELYWPGDHTHPRKNPDITPGQVYLVDRSRASTYDFIVLLCAAPSYGVGQENEIATQAGLSAIRLVPKGMSRMMKGSFINSVDIEYTGELSSGIDFEPAKLSAALRTVRLAHFRRQAFYKAQNGHDFGERLRKLINERGTDYVTFADDVGVNLAYVHALIKEPFNVSNPSTKILKRIAHRLGESVGYLIGESERGDPTWTASQASFREWVAANPALPASNVFQMRDKWREEYHLNKSQPVSVSFRKRNEAMAVADWDRMYKDLYGKGGNARSASLFEK